MLREKRRHANSKPNRKLDRKSSRGMIYENEELRLRTININAEVERGQSDIKKLRRENDHLRREIWSLRDEYDRLDKLLRNTQGLTNEVGGADRQPADRTGNYAGGEEEDEDDDEDGEEEEEEDEEDEDEEEEPICEQCQQFEDSCECSLPTGELRKISAATAFRPRPPPRHDKPNFDDLSVVSEETTHSADTNATDPDAMNRLSLNAPALGVFEYQSNVPPLAHFENLCYEKIGPNLNASGDLVFEGAHVSAERVDADFLLPSPPPIPLPRSPLPMLVPEAFQDGGALSSPSPSIGPPDICMYSTSAPAPLRMRSRNGSGGSGSNGGGAVGRFSTGGNLEDLLHDLDNLSVEHSMHSSAGSGDKTPKRKQRSEMNLVLTIDGDTTTISPVTPAAIPIQVDSPATVASTPQAPPIGWKPELPPKPDKPPKPKFPWVTRSPGAADKHPLATAKSPPRSCMKTPTPPAPPPLSPLPQLQSAQQQMRRKSIPVVLDKQLQLQPQPHAAKAITATISKRRFSLRRNSDAASAGSGGAGGGGSGGSGAKLAIASGQPGAAGGSASGGPGGSSAERTTTHSVSSSPESSASHRSQHPAAPARTQARRISTGSHDNATGSIPWCACWGNGCI